MKFLFFLILFISCSECFGYRPSAPLILEDFLKERPKYTTITAVIAPFDCGEGLKIKSGELFLKSGSKTVLILLSEKEEYYIIEIKKGQITDYPSGFSQNLPLRSDLIYKFLLFDGKDQLLSLLDGAGIKSSEVNYGRYGNGISYIVGSKENDFSKTQIWFEKWGHKVSRYISKGFDFKYVYNKESTGELLFPTSIVIAYNNSEICTLVFSNIKRADFSEDSLLIKNLMKKYKIK